MTNSENPEIGLRLRVGQIDTNYHDQGEGHPVLLIHGSGPGVTAWANWRLNIGPLAERARVLAPDMVGFACASNARLSPNRTRLRLLRIRGSSDAFNAISGPIPDGSPNVTAILFSAIEKLMSGDTRN